MAPFNNIPEISIEGFQVVSGEMFVHSSRKNEATCTLWATSVTFNKMSLLALNNCERVRMEVNPKTKGMLIVPVTVKDKDGVRWTSGVKEPAVRKIECKQFASQLYEAWKFDSSRVYRTTGKIVSADKKIMLLFDFSKAESWKFRERNKVTRDG